MNYDTYQIQSSGSGDTTNSNFGTSVLSEVPLRERSMGNLQTINSATATSNSNDNSPIGNNSNKILSSTSQNQYELYGNNDLNTAQIQLPQSQPEQGEQKLPPTSNSTLNNTASAGSAGQRNQLFGIGQTNKFPSYSWGSTPVSSTTTNYNHLTNTRDMWSSSATGNAVSPVGLNTANTTLTSGSVVPKMQNMYYNSSDSIYTPMYDDQALNQQAQNLGSNNEIDALTLHLMQLSSATVAAGTKKDLPNTMKNYIQPQNSYNKWPSYSGQSASAPMMQSGSGSQQAYLNSQTQQQQQQQQNMMNNQQIAQSQNLQQSQATQQQLHHSQQIRLPPSQLSMNSKASSTDLEDLKIRIQLKDMLISKLETELSEVNTILKSASSKDGSSQSFEIPKNHEDLYSKLSEKLQTTQEELDETKVRLEAVLTAIALNPNQSTTKNGRYDEEEVAHKIITKMQMLTEENEEMSKMLSYGKSKEKDIEIGILRKQNQELKEKVAKLETKIIELKK